MTEKQKPVKPKLEWPERINASPEDIARSMFNSAIDWIAVDAEAGRKWEKHQADMRQYRKDTEEHERRNS